MFGDSAGGGKFPYAVRFTAFEYIAITGKTDRGVSTYADEVALVDASHLWEKDTNKPISYCRRTGLCQAHTQRSIELENQVGIASVVSDTEDTC